MVEASFSRTSYARACPMWLVLTRLDVLHDISVRDEQQHEHCLDLTSQ